MKRLLENLLEQDIFKPPTEEELEQRAKEFEQRKIEIFIKEYNGKLNPDGSYDFDRGFGRYSLSSVIENGRFIIKFGKVKGDFNCSDNNLTSLEGAPKYVGWDFYCRRNKKKFTEEEVRKVSEVKGKIIV